MGQSTHALSVFLRANNTLIIERFVPASRAEGLPPEGADRQAIIDHLTQFLAACANSLECLVNDTTASATKEIKTARLHGAQRWHLGYQIKDMVREYDVLRRCILELMEESGTQASHAQFDQLANLLNLGISEAVEEFTQRNEEILRATREQAIAIVAHDLGGPLHVVVGNTALIKELVESGSPQPDQVLKLLGGVKRATTTMRRLIANLLELSRIEAGHLPLERRAEHVSSILKEAVQDALPLAEEKSIRLAFECAWDGTLMCDRARLLQVFANLIGNAVKFTPKSGVVMVSAADNGSEVRFDVRDTGPGVATEHLPFLFDRFWQAPESRHLGTGLGLAIAKGFVAAHGGVIGAESKVGTGSNFWFTIPKAPPVNNS